MNSDPEFEQSKTAKDSNNPDEVKDNTEDETTPSTSSKEIKENAFKIYEELSKEMSKDDEEYLDFNLNDDQDYIYKYYSFLK